MIRQLAQCPYCKSTEIALDDAPELLINPDSAEHAPCAHLIFSSLMSPLKALDTELSIRLARALNPDVKIILGGNHASAFPERWIECGADFVVVGEGEVAFRKLMEAIVSRHSTFDDLPNLVYSDQGRAKATGIEAPKVDLNLVPLPRWDLFDLRPRIGFASAAVVSPERVTT